jgi:hypothetical protein
LGFDRLNVFLSQKIFWYFQNLAGQFIHIDLS